MLDLDWTGIERGEILRMISPDESPAIPTLLSQELSGTAYPSSPSSQSQSSVTYRYRGVFQPEAGYFLGSHFRAENG